MGPVTEASILLISAEKDALLIALEFAPEAREKSSLLTMIARTGMSDGKVSINSDQNAYLQRELPIVMASEGIKGSKLDSSVGPVVVQSMLERLQETFRPQA